MATLVLGGLGTLIGGPLGGAIGSLIGRQVDGAILGGGTREGARLKELAATTSSYGTPLPRHFGRMRVPGSVIWATELVEHSDTQGGGKGRPSVRTYTYTASFAVALASRPIAGVGRIWADGNLLRGEAGDLKAEGAMRVHLGHGDQAPDPLIAAAEGAARCPAWRGTAYVVFEDLALGDFFNRIPALTFEVIADPSGFSLRDIVEGVVADADADVALDGLTGLSSEGPLAETLELLAPLYPMNADAGGGVLTIARERLQDAPILFSEAAVATGDDSFGQHDGLTRRRSAAPVRPPEILRYYDIGRDYLPGLQHAGGRARQGQPQTVELPAAMTAADARLAVERIARRAAWARDRIAWRTAELDPVIAPGAIATLPGRAGRWRVLDWEWRESGVELTLERVVPAGADAAPAAPVDPGRINPAPDLLAPATKLVAFELPWDGTGSGDTPALFAAVSAGAANWSGAALFADRGAGELLPLGPSGRTRSVLGVAQTALAAASPLLFDRTSSVVVELIDEAMTLAPATGRQIAAGANRALLGSEIVQFAHAEALGLRRWRLAGLLRGRGGTESAVAGHAAGEAFVLLDARPVALDPAIVGPTPGAEILAAGRGDDRPVASGIALRGATLRPLAPVHPRVASEDGGALTLRWTRRARGAWLWPDGVDTPLHEQTERYQVTFGPVAAPVALWNLAEPVLTLPPALRADLAAALPGGALRVRQQGSYALSEPLFLTTLA